MVTHITLEEVRFDFHSIDRQAYHRLVTEMGLAPCQCKRIVAFWNWLERVGYRYFIFNTLPLPDESLGALANETTKCLNCLAGEALPIGDNEVLPVMSSVAGQDIYQDIVYTNKENVMITMASFMENVCEKTFFIPPNSADAQPSTSNGEVAQEQEQANNDQDRARVLCQNNRTLFVTFSKGHPITKKELEEFFMRRYGQDCIEYIDMNIDQPALFARVVITSPQYIERILGQRELVQFNVYGKDIRIRRFVDRLAQL